jgi:hypothetical protein
MINLFFAMVEAMIVTSVQRASVIPAAAVAVTAAAVGQYL